MHSARETACTVQRRSRIGAGRAHRLAAQVGSGHTAGQCPTRTARATQLTLKAMPMPDPWQVELPTRLHTARLLLRPFTEDDASALHEALVESIEALRAHLWFLPWVAEAPTLHSARVRCQRAAGNFLLRTDLPYLVFDQATGRLLGSVGLHRTDWALPGTEVGYWLRNSATGAGYASEAVNALTDWAFTGMKAQRVALVTDVLNTGSRAVAARCGFHLEGVLRHHMRGPQGELRDTCLYARLAPQAGPNPADPSPL